MPKVPSRGFSGSEFAGRLRAIQAQMETQSLGALLLTTESDIFYFSGFLSQFWQSPTRPWFVVIPASGLPIGVIPEIGVNAMTSEFMTDIRSWPSPHATDDGVSLLAETVLEVLAQSQSCTLGINKGRETHIRMPLNDVESLMARLRSGMPDLAVLDATPAIQAVRMLKSEAEIDKIRYVAQCVSDVFERLFTFAEVGMSDADLFRVFIRSSFLWDSS